MPPRRKNERLQEPITLSLDHGTLTATTTAKLWSVPAGKRLRVDRVWYCNPTGLAADPTNAFSLEIRNGATVVASVFNTDNNDVPAGVALAADAIVTGVLSATPANLALAAGDTLSAVFTEDGTATLPAGRLVIEGRLI
jgi:hypothetical protein